MPTESQLRDGALRESVRQRIENGQLPSYVPNRIEAGYGCGDICVACDQPVTDAQIEYEVEDDRNGRLSSFHFGCYVVWQLECARANLAPTRRTVGPPRG
jgi:hypothetical protein